MKCPKMTGFDDGYGWRYCIKNKAYSIIFLDQIILLHRYKDAVEYTTTPLSYLMLHHYSQASTASIFFLSIQPP